MRIETDLKFNSLVDEKIKKAINKIDNDMRSLTVPIKKMEITATTIEKDKSHIVTREFKMDVYPKEEQKPVKISKAPDLTTFYSLYKGKVISIREVNKSLARNKIKKILNIKSTKGIHLTVNRIEPPKTKYRKIN